MKYFIYCRKSSETEDRQVASIESQLSTLRRTFDGRSDIELVRIYEEAFSAKEPAVSIDEFEQVRRLLQRPGSPKPQRHSFAFTGMIRCGSCGLRVTPEHKFNRFGSHYIYYHCSKRRLGPR